MKTEQNSTVAEEMGGDHLEDVDEVHEESPEVVTQEQAEKLTRTTTVSNALRVAVVVATLLLAAAINSLADIPGTVRENTAKIEGNSDRMDRHVKEADRHFQDLSDDIKEMRALQVEILKEIQK